MNEWSADGVVIRIARTLGAKGILTKLYDNGQIGLREAGLEREPLLAYL